jgi:hypothetical protein
MHHDEAGYHEENVNTDITHHPGGRGSRVSRVAAGNIKQSMVDDDKPGCNRSERLDKMKFHSDLGMALTNKKQWTAIPMQHRLNWGI